MGFDTSKVAAIINISGHRLPSNFNAFLKQEGFRSVVIYSEDFWLDIKEEEKDTWDQITDKVMALGQQKSERGQRFVDMPPGNIILFLPSLSAPAVMLAMAIEAVMGTNTHLKVALVRRTEDDTDYVVAKLIDLGAWRAYWRSNGRSALLNLAEVKEIELV